MFRVIILSLSLSLLLAGCHPDGYHTYKSYHKPTELTDHERQFQETLEIQHRYDMQKMKNDLEMERRRNR